MRSLSKCSIFGTLVATVLLQWIWPNAVLAQPAQETDWQSAPGMGTREIRTSSVRVVGSIVEYQFRFSTQPQTIWNVEVNCSTPAYRDRLANAAFGEWQTLDHFGETTQSEHKFVCSRFLNRRSAPEPNRNRPQAGATPPPTVGSRSTGSGFAVSATHIVTNHHVVDDCSAISIRTGDRVVSAEIITATAQSDLALLATEQQVGPSASIRTTAALGEDITVAGFPLAGLLSRDLIVTSGQVNSLAGLGNNPSLLQISAPVQSGNSGGPLLDRAGAIVGVVVSKLDVARAAKVTGDMAQSVNFAIKPEVLRLFLDTNRVKYRIAPRGQRIDGTALAERARQFTVQIICEK